MKIIEKKISGWGNYPARKGKLVRLPDSGIPGQLLSSFKNMIPRGNGRSYGDAASGSVMADLTFHNRLLEFDREQGIIHCESGLLLSDLLQKILPEGYFLYVSPGTKYVSVGGAIAADIHGKNHHKEGCFSDYLIDFQLLRSDGTIITCSRSEHPDWFWATCGGMGLTGIILSAKFSVRKVETAYIDQTSIRTRNLKETLEHIEASEDSTYSVSWIDCLAKGEKLGRGIILNGEHTAFDGLPENRQINPLKPFPKKAHSIPFFFPSFTLNRQTIRAFNLLYYQRHPNGTVHRTVHFEPYFYPLDKLKFWNRIYGRPGFTQYQCVLPKAAGLKGIQTLLRQVRDQGTGSFLSVLKLMGPAQPNSPLNFPMEGYTLAMDFPINQSTLQLLDKLDRIVLQYGGRLYLAKDARMSQEFFKKTYPDWETFQDRFMNPKYWQSDLSKRLGLGERPDC